MEGEGRSWMGSWVDVWVKLTGKAGGRTLNDCHVDSLFTNEISTGGYVIEVTTHVSEADVKYGNRR